MTNLNTLWARLISAVFHPLLLPSISIIVLFAIPSFVSFSVSSAAQRLITLIVFINTCIAPVLVIMFMKRMGMITSVLLDERKDRIYPVMVSAMFYLFTWYLFRQANLPSLVNYFIIGATLLVLIGFVVTFYWKISIHMMSMGGFTGFLIAISFVLQFELIYLITASLLVSGLVGTARLKLNAHNPPQVYAGFLTGVMVMLLLFLWLRG